MASEDQKKNVLDVLKKAQKGAVSQKTLEEKVGQPTNSDPDDEFDSNPDGGFEDGFDLNLLINSGEVKKVIKDGNIKAYFRTVPTKMIFEIDSETDVITASVLSGNSRRGLRYACASILGYGIKDKYIDFKNKTWQEKEELFLKMPNILVNKLLQLHARFERDAALLFTPDTVKNS